VAQSLPAWRVIHVLDRVAADRGLPRSIVCDHGPEFAGQAMDQWAHAHGVALQFIRPGQPIENAFLEDHLRRVAYSTRLGERIRRVRIGVKRRRTARII
jgi:transposase InsO family protein